MFLYCFMKENSPGRLLALLYLWIQNSVYDLVDTSQERKKAKEHDMFSGIAVMFRNGFSLETVFCFGKMELRNAEKSSWC